MSLTPKLPSSRRAIAAAFAATILAFVVSTLISQFQIRAIEGAADLIAHDDMPSIEHLAAARLELHRLESLVRRYIDDAAQGKPLDVSEIEESRARFSAESRAYLELPADHGERELYAEVREQVGALDASVTRILQSVQAHDLRAARAELESSLRANVQRTSRAVLEVAAFNASLGARRAARIEQIRHSTLTATLWLTALAVVLGFGASLISWRTVGANERLLQLHNHTLEERARELEAFSGRVAHDVLSPLSGVSLALDGIARRCSCGGAAKLVERGRSSLGRVRTVVDGLLAFARSGARPDPSDRASVREVVTGIVEELGPAAGAAGIDLRAEPVPAPGLEVACSPGVLSSLLVNLVQNALKYMGDSAVRRIRVRGTECGGGARVRVEVEDTGPGIAPDLTEKVFDPYVRASTRAGGIGLGLATVRRLAQSHRGAAGVESRVGVGSLFWFELPAAAPGSCSAADEDRSAEQPSPERLEGVRQVRVES